MKINIDFIYPVGSIYMSTNNVNPQTLFGGTWTKIEGRFLLGSSSSYSLGSTGGEASHTLILNEIPALKYPVGGTESAVFGTGVGTGKYGVAGSVGHNIGGGKAHNNMPPYQVVNIWRRTA